jgi:hypothetical protein
MKKLFSIAVLISGLSVVVQAQSQSNLNTLALDLLKKMPASGYANRQLCISGDTVVGTYGFESWSVRGLATGTVSNFPITSAAITDPTSVPFKVNYPTGPDDWKRFPILEGNQESGIFLSDGTVDSQPATICIFESRPVLE